MIGTDNWTWYDYLAGYAVEDYQECDEEEVDDDADLEPNENENEEDEQQ